MSISEGQAVFLSVVVSFVGLSLLCGSLWLCFTALDRDRQITSRDTMWPVQGRDPIEWLHEVRHWLGGPRPEFERFLWELSQAIKLCIVEYRDRIDSYLTSRNDLWVAYAQVSVAILIATLLTVLLLTRTISAEAGLPILSGVGGFAIAKGASAGRGSSGNLPGLDGAPDTAPRRQEG